ncbi:MAG TPA: tetratricopeptide repeat protein [Vicinamibacteria bacterium]|nr:tetratricopeptide repeat protein [Vicinamibacteria bacterium]
MSRRRHRLPLPRPIHLALLLLIAPAAAAQGSGDVAQALEMVRSGDCAGALPRLEAILQQQPGHLAVRKVAGRCQLKQGRWDAARAHFEAVLRATPGDGDAADGLSAAMAEIQKVEQVRQTLDIDAREKTEEKLRAMHAFRAAEEHLRAGRVAEAEALLADVVKRHPESAPPAVRLAEIYSSSRRFKAAAELYARLAAAPDATPQHGLAAARNLQWAAAYPEAAERYRAYLGTAPKDVDARLGRATSLALAKRCAEAVPEYEKVIAARPKSVDAYLGLAECQDQLGQTEKALAAYERAIALDPRRPQAVKGRDRAARFVDEVARKRGFAALDRGDHAAAITHFEAYLKAHPDSAETLLQLARLHAWMEDEERALVRYEAYLARVPGDAAARRELARVALWAARYETARRHLRVLVESPEATAEDHERMIQSFLWAGEPLGAEPYIAPLSRLRPDSGLVSEARVAVTSRKRVVARTSAEQLAAKKQFRDAVNAYRSYMSEYGRDEQVELQVARILSWDRDLDASAATYREYLANRPDDHQARVELANVERWAGRYAASEAEYRAVLAARPDQAEAALGLAQALEAAGTEPHTVRRAYRDALSLDATNAVALERVQALGRALAPVVAFRESAFTDADGLDRSASALEVTLSLPHRVRVTPYATFGYFHQVRHLFAPDEGVAAINRETDARGGRTLAQGGGLRLELLGKSRWSLLAEAGPTFLDPGATEIEARAVANLRTESDRTAFTVQYGRRLGAYDLDTASTLVAGLVADTVTVSWRQALPGIVRFYTTNGLLFVRGGEAKGFDDNRQYRLSARLWLEPSGWGRLGYTFRQTGFDERSALYYSPERYRTHALDAGLTLEKKGTVRVDLDGEYGFAEADGVKSREAAGNLAVGRAAHGAPRLVYRYSRGRTSAFGSRTYDAHRVHLELSRILHGGRP